MDPILDVERCVRIHNNNVIVEEPLDRMVFLIHNLLILQPHEQEGRQSFTETSYDFSLSQDHEVKILMFSFKFGKFSLEFLNMD